MNAQFPVDERRGADEVAIEAPALSEVVSSSESEGRSSPPELTTRQRQILALLQAGKVNKEIASELGIGVGTVKQHVVALFKRLNVHNRTMAASRGMSLLQSAQHESSVMVSDGLLERRPCIVLSIALPDEVDRQAVRLLHGVLAALAYDHDALFLARKGNAGDLIFGVQRVTEFDLIKALQTAYAIHCDIARQFPELTGVMRGGITAGLAVASMKRFGGWSGEAVASAAIASARALAHGAPAGRIAVGREALELMQAFGIGQGQDASRFLSFSSLDSLLWTGERSSFVLIGRHSELSVLESALRESALGNGQLVCLRAEAGMGKSRLCREIYSSCQRVGGVLHFFHGQPDFLGDSQDVSNSTAGLLHSVNEVAGVLRSTPLKLPELVIVDDFHLLNQEKQCLLWAAAVDARSNGRMVVFSARRFVEPVPASAKLVQLVKLSRDELSALAGVVLDQNADTLPPNGIECLVDKAAGVPLFAVELAKCRGDWKKALSLMIVVCSRLDNLNLDRRLLNAVARNSGKALLKDVASALGENVGNLRPNLDLAVASGVVSEGPDGRLSIAHPLLRQLIEYLDME
ncbi:MAG: hypothetical protein KGZ83_00025 [Sulfuricella sp.]|nr:hypothetical protein [Sulfuricella sp.]